MILRHFKSRKEALQFMEKYKKSGRHMALIQKSGKFNVRILARGQRWMVKIAKYVSVNKPIIIKRFEFFKAPTGWQRLKFLKMKLREDKEYRAKFTSKEIKQIMIGKET